MQRSKDANSAGAPVAQFDHGQKREVLFVVFSLLLVDEIEIVKLVRARCANSAGSGATWNDNFERSEIIGCHRNSRPGKLFSVLFLFLFSIQICMLNRPGFKAFAQKEFSFARQNQRQAVQSVSSSLSHRRRFFDDLENLLFFLLN